MADKLSPQVLSKIIGSIYDCALDPGRWEAALADIIEALDCTAASLNLDDIKDNRFLIHRNVGIDPYWRQEQVKHLPEIHDHLVNCLAVEDRVPGRCVTAGTAWRR